MAHNLGLLCLKDGQLWGTVAYCFERLLDFPGSWLDVSLRDGGGAGLGAFACQRGIGATASELVIVHLATGMPISPQNPHKHQSGVPGPRLVRLLDECFQDGFSGVDLRVSVPWKLSSIANLRLDQAR